MNDKKVFRDPIYELISFNKVTDTSLLQIINSCEFQRLRRIRQLGVSYYTYPTSTHDRFSHSLGVAFIIGIMVENLLNISDKIEKEEITSNGEKLVINLNKQQIKTLLQITALLHDIGHGPFSHAFEKITQIDHEEMSRRIILNAQGEIKDILGQLEDEILKKYASKWIIEILDGTFRPIWIKELITSQLDADRIDYLLRDAYMCGVHYATFDWKWLFQNMEIGTIKSESRDGLLINANKGIHAVESFIVSRYHMYEQVYFHKTTRGFEVLVGAIFKRLKYLIDGKKSNYDSIIDENLLSYIIDNNDVDTYLKIDDFLLISQFNKWQLKSDDEILKELCKCFVLRKPFKKIKEVSDDALWNRNENITINKILTDEKFDYYYFIDDYKNVAYKDSYLLGKKDATSAEHIWLQIGKEQSELAEVSPIIRSLKNRDFRRYRAYLHRDYLQNEQIKKFIEV